MKQKRNEAFILPTWVVQPKRILHLIPALVFVTACSAGVLQKSDVVFMYQADAPVYTQYDATVVAWGGKPSPVTLEAAKGLQFFGSIGMVTEFARYYERFQTNYSDGLCRDIHGQPVKVPWLTDHQHKGIPYWWCCTQQPVFKQYLRERVVETIAGGAHGIHIDDHLGTAGGLWLGLCFCDRCVQGFKSYLQTLNPDRLKKLGINNAETFNYRDTVRDWITSDKTGNRKPPHHPLWHEWSVYQYKSAASFMAELHALANKEAGRQVPMGANAGLLWPGHLADYKVLDFFSAETDHHASTKCVSDSPLFAYRLAEAVGRPYAATASGQDWAFIKANNLPRLARSWIAYAYGAGQLFMAPHHQWCYTPEKGTHWYNGPPEVFAPVYRFVRKNAELLDGYETYSDVGVVVPHRAYMRDPIKFISMCTKLAAANVSFRVLLGGDEIVDHELGSAELEHEKALLVVDEADLLETDRDTLSTLSKKKPVYRTVDDVLSKIEPAVQAEPGAPVRLLPRVKSGKAVVHVLNCDYSPDYDDVREIRDLKLEISFRKLGLSPAYTVRWVPFGDSEQALKLVDGRVVLPRVPFWGFVVIEP